MLLKMKN